MSSGYSVDDILAEIENKKKKTSSNDNTGVISPKKQGKTREEVPFNLKGMTEDFDSPKVKKVGEGQGHEEKELPLRREPKIQADRFKNADDQFTLTIDLNSTKAGDTDRNNMAAAHKLSHDLQNQRREKVKEFMEKSNFENKDFDFDDEDRSEIKKTFGFGTKAEVGSDKKKSKKMFSKTKKEKEQAESFDDSEEEFNSLRDIADVSDDIASIQKSLIIRTVATGILFLILFYLSLCNLYPLPLLKHVMPRKQYEGLSYFKCKRAPYFCYVFKFRDR